MNNFTNAIKERAKAQFDGAWGYVSTVIDILLIAAILYVLFLFLKKNHCAKLIKVVAITLVVGAILASHSLGLNMAGKLAGMGVMLGVMFFALLFTQEMRRLLYKLSSHRAASGVFTTQYNCSDEELKNTIDAVVKATQNMAKKDVGALMIIAPQEIPPNILQSGTKMDSVLSSPLLECIFNTKAPLHDGAVFIRGNRIIAAGCFLPLTQNTELDKELGTRHRAAIGVTETNNVLAIIVSEETGIISTAFNGEIQRYYDSEMLHERLEQMYGLKAIENKNEKKLRKRK